MADFLTSMTQRTLGLLPVVQPIIASKYVSEAMGAAVPGALRLLDHFPGQVAEEPFEQWEEPVEQLPLAAQSQSLLQRRAPASRLPMPGVSPSVASAGRQPRIAPMPQAVPAPLRPQAVPPARVMAGGKTPSPVVPQPQASPVRSSGSQPLVNRLPGNNPSPVRKDKDAPPAVGIESEVVSSPLQISDFQENPPFPTTPTRLSVPTMKHRGGQDKPASSQARRETGMLSTTEPASSQDTHPARSQQSMGNTPLVPVEPRVLAAASRLFEAGDRAVPAKKQQPGPGVEQGLSSPLKYMKSNSDTGSSPAILSEAKNLMPGGESSSRGEILRFAQNERMGLVQNDGNDHPGSVRLRTGRLVPQGGHLAPGAAVSPVTLSEAKNDRRDGTGSARLMPGGASAALVSPASRLSEPARIAPALDSLMEPLLSPAYRPGQSRAMASPAAEKRAGAQPAETQAESTIRITIGRIDVRAVAPAPAAPAPVKTKRPAPALSLDDYLKQRNGRKP